MLYELKFLTRAFPQGQFEDPPVPTNVSSSGIFSSVLSKYFTLLLIYKLYLESNRFIMVLIRMLEKDCLVRITSRQLLYELENLTDD